MDGVEKVITLPTVKQARCGTITQGLMMTKPVLHLHAGVWGLGQEDTMRVSGKTDVIFYPHI